MRKFLFRLVAFGAFLTIAFGIVYLINRLYLVRDSYNNAFTLKAELISNTPPPKVVVIGGSNVAFGLDSKLLADSLRRKVVNAGLVAGVGMKYTLDSYEPLLRRGDVAVIQPEYDHFYGTVAYGNPETAGFLPYLKDFDPRRLNREQLEIVVKGFFKTTLQSFVKSIYYELNGRLRGKKTGVFEYKLSGFNSLGDEQSHWTLPPGETSNEPVGFMGTYNYDYERHLTDQLKRIKQGGVEIIMMPPVTSQRNVELNRDSIAKIYDRMAHEGFAFVVQPDTLSYADSLLYNTAYHLKREGVVINSKRMAKILSEHIKSR